MWVCVAYGDVHWFNIIGSCERWSTLGLIKNRQHREAIWHCVRREDKLSVLWPNKCFHFIPATRPVWSGMTGMLSLPRSIHYSQLSAGLHLNSPPASVPVLKAQTDIHTHSKSLVNLFSFIHIYTHMYTVIPDMSAVMQNSGFRHCVSQFLLFLALCAIDEWGYP